MHIPNKVRNTLQLLETFFPSHIFSGSFLMLSGWKRMNGWMQILNAVMGVDWIFYGHSLSRQATTAYKSNSKENE